MKKLIAFNWKMNPQSAGEARRLLAYNLQLLKDARKKADIVVCPPFVCLNGLKAKKFEKLNFGAQDCFWENQGAYTGEISPLMLKKSGVKYVIIGHSERRKYLRENDEMINKKVSAAMNAGLKVILCVGEDAAIRRRGMKAVKNFIKNQLRKDLKGITKNLTIAYEPIWAIGTGNPCNPTDALETIKFIKNVLAVNCRLWNSKVLYGGSVTGKNVKSYVKYPEIDGALVGGASLKPKEVKNIIKL